ncbi:hypothetical protein [Phaffia rhodozyma]|uniref:Uncharacterized protein n=1 Tax=Phaffia rhodozyma TaxID=264483 RepID=A0A0F7SI15_PHARH|nr:hypothetical protein [Phaffia rhodozyma]
MQHSVSDGYRLLKQELSTLSPSSLKLLSSGTLGSSDTRLSLVLGFIPQSAQMPAKKVAEDNWEMVEPATPPRATPTSPNPSNWSPPRWAIPHSPSSSSKPTSSIQPGSNNGDTADNTWSPPKWAIPLRPTVKQAPLAPFGWKPPFWARSVHTQPDVLLNPVSFVKLRNSKLEVREKHTERVGADGEMVWIPPRWATKAGLPLLN